MLSLASKLKTEFVYGLMDNNKKIIDSRKKPDYFFQTKENGLRKFIKNCPANSSCIFISKKHYFSSGGCNESFISPDQVLFLRLFSKGNGIFLKEIVALLPSSDQIKGRLSTQIKRSRYESILALIKFCEDNRNIDKNIKKWAYKRAASRTYNYYKYFNKSFFSIYLLYYLSSKFFFPSNFIDNMYRFLEVFKGDRKKRPKNWITGSDKAAISKVKIRI